MKASIVISDLSSKNLLLFHVHLLCTQNYPKDQYEIILPDLGHFTKQQVILLNNLEMDYPHFRILRGQETSRSCLINLAAKESKGEWLFFVESHCIMPRNWLATYINFLEREKVSAACGLCESLPTSSWARNAEGRFKKCIDVDLKGKPEGEAFLDFHHTAILKEVFIAYGGICEDLPILGEFDLGARLHHGGVAIHTFSECKVWHENDTGFSDYMNIVCQNGKERMLLYFQRDQEFVAKYFGSRLLQLYPKIKYFRLLLIAIFKIVVLMGRIGCFFSNAFKKQKAYDFFFRHSAINANRTGCLYVSHSPAVAIIKRLLKKTVRFFQNIFFISPKVPRHVDIEISTSCNLKCKMCSKQLMDFDEQVMPYKAFIQIIDKLQAGVEIISFGGYGEMLLCPEHPEMIRYAKNKGFFTQLTSNGILLNSDNRIINIFDSGLAELRISLDYISVPSQENEVVGHDFSQSVIDNIKRLSSLRKEKRYKTIVGINTVVTRNNLDQIVQIISFAEEYGLDSVTLIRFDSHGNNINNCLDLQEEKAFYREIHMMPKKVKVTTPFNRFTGIRRLYNLSYKYCPFRLQMAHIRINGSVTPCPYGFAFHDFGNIFEKDISEIWTGTLFRQIHQNKHNPICQECDIF